MVRAVGNHGRTSSFGAKQYCEEGEGKEEGGMKGENLKSVCKGHAWCEEMRQIAHVYDIVGAMVFR